VNQSRLSDSQTTAPTCIKGWGRLDSGCSAEECAEPIDLSKTFCYTEIGQANKNVSWFVAAGSLAEAVEVPWG
jgi:hypothetical protein